MSSSRTTGLPARDSIGGAHLSLGDQVYLEVRERIIDGRCPSGHRVVERELADELGVSRIPVREALQRLEAEGFITVRARRGAFVAPLGPAEAADFFDIRERLEALAASLAAARADAEGLRTLEKLLERARRAAGSARRNRELVSIHADFHQQIVVMAGNPLLLDLMAPLDGRLRRLFSLTTEPADGVAMCGEHERLYAAIRDGDPAAAERIARAHVSGTREAALRLLAASAAADAPAD
ncbi:MULTISPECIES: GntR family transcriptional regulator [Streptomyces]|uniref:GntR family transcriptional regulator n=1 Tax=Streptomyces tsukubensis (strain DSM 42081 / NBRC 108919 / NRRL 18488 / 9993) TaxID=1114943 RepID=I2NBA4_STRT9|nr:MULTISPECIES: GntR family transcriptional regulator [Streptomyces]AZK98034.1 GntR family transcriptional regulator [Streptomyces tsukubensis]EIF94301.1 GntR family transcriptional regulator [Streptomyces tsukubensis NRRL18488]MYS66170.1 FCD domain-containing protein [Streptomyces sp. SID5473]QKM66044.1 GntR family transcriptional regulator [Streptomyces tsukubensis NRRL18488]TAI42324.1 GntR family transcriptional regulator [Streptomyces tsukubensis]